ncbi:MAG: hypothetical protein HUJ51_01575, partial [Eggerthellaceae bacterium]|nr:hypothetical protein [Eggerthellaceae bacterium]
MNNPPTHNYDWPSTREYKIIKISPSWVGKNMKSPVGNEIKGYNWEDMKSTNPDSREYDEFLNGETLPETYRYFCQKYFGVSEYYGNYTCEVDLASTLGNYNEDNKFQQYGEDMLQICYESNKAPLPNTPIKHDTYTMGNGFNIGGTVGDSGSFMKQTVFESKQSNVWLP